MPHTLYLEPVLERQALQAKLHLDINTIAQEIKQNLQSSISFLQFEEN
jgi:hypothetical protein